MATKATGRARSWDCKACEKKIRVPKGWQHLPAVRKHYWAKHREIMQPSRRKKR